MENEKLIENQEQYLILEALREAGIQLTSSLEQEPVLDAILTQTLNLVKAGDAHIFLYNDGKLTFGSARWADARKSEPFSEPREEGITYSVARGGKRIVSSNVNENPLFQKWQWGGAIVSLPLKIGEQVVGVMNVAYEQPHEFSPEELRVLELLAVQAAIALQNASLYEEVSTDRRRLRLLYEVTNALVSEYDSSVILQKAIDLTTTALKASSGEAFLLDRLTGELRLAAQSPKRELSVDDRGELIKRHLAEGLEGWVASHRVPVWIPNVNHDPRWLNIDDFRTNVSSALCVPIQAGEDLLGVISILSEDYLNEDQLDLLNAISKQVALALSNALKFHRVERGLAELSALQQVGRVVNSRLEMQSLLDEVVEQVRQVLGYEIVEIYLVEGEMLQLKAAKGSEDGLAHEMHWSEGIIGRVTRTNQAAYIPDVSKDPDYVVGYPDSKSEIVVPLSKGDIVIGVLNVESPELGGLGESDLQLLILLADQVLVAVENATLYNRLQKHSSQLERLVEERTSELAEALEQARVAERLKTQFVADVSHELRTPLANIRLYLELLNFGNPERSGEYLETLLRENDRLAILIEDLLAISSLDTGTAMPNLKAEDLNTLVHRLVMDRKRMLAEKSLKLNLEMGDQLPNVMVDEGMITQVIASLMTNAMHYTRAGGTISINTKIQSWEDEEWVTLTVADTGIGIPPEEQERVFERFYRGKASRMLPVPGTGLGLAISKEIVDRHHGHISLQSKVDQGSEFTVWLPLHHEKTS
ncbi:MAG: GAF domain-containing protein [Chloroflexi bacterium]|nr:GAF domain-containing protein [Chloroflexota bacterium]